MRRWALFFAGESIANELRNAARVRPEDYPYTLDTLRSIAQLAGAGATLWLTWKKKRTAGIFAGATTAICAGLSAAQRRKRDRPIEIALDSVANVACTAALLAPAASSELALPLDLTPRNPATPFTRPERLRNLASLYAAYTLVGHWAEMLFCQLIKAGIVDGDYDRSNTMLWDWWLHPFPAEGMAGLMIALFLEPASRRLVYAFGGRIAPALAVSFLANQVVCTSIDYLTGMVANRNYELWDYRDMPFNYKGQICLQNSLVYTVAATAVTWLAYPARQSWIARMPSDVANLGFAAFAPVYAFCSLLYFV